MTSLAYAESINNYDSSYDMAEALSAAREEAKEQIINKFRNGEVVRFSSNQTWSLDEALEDLAITDAKLDLFIQNEQEH